MIQVEEPTIQGTYSQQCRKDRANNDTNGMMIDPEQCLKLCTAQ